MIRFLMLYTSIAIGGLIILQLPLAEPLQTVVGIGLAKITWLIISLFDATVTLQGAVLRHGTAGIENGIIRQIR